MISLIEQEERHEKTGHICDRLHIVLFGELFILKVAIIVAESADSSLECRIGSILQITAYSLDQTVDLSCDQLPEASVAAAA